MASLKPRRELLSIWRIYVFVIALIPAFFISLFMSIMGTLWIICTAVWLVIFIFLYALYFPLLYRRKAFSLDGDRLVSRGGVVYRYVHSLPLANIQYVSLMAGPLERLFGICSLVVVASGGRMVLSGLGHTDGRNLISVLTDAATPETPAE